LKILFLTFKTFSANSGMEKMCRLAGMATNEYCIQSGAHFYMYSLYDDKKIKTEPYLPRNTVKGFGGGRVKFIIKSLVLGRRCRVVVLANINLLLPGYLVKLFSPKTKIILVAQGIEPPIALTPLKKRMLKKIDLVITVSEAAKESLQPALDIAKEKFRVLGNCLDPFIPGLSTDAARRHEYRSNYGIADNDFVLMTLSTLSSKKKRRGYDKVLIALKKLHAIFPSVKYLFVGKYDADEKLRLHDVIRDLGIEEDVIFTGFVPDSVVADYYGMCDLFIIPGDKEGFGFRYIEALYYNKPVIASRSRSNAENIYGHDLGTLVDPDSQDEMTAAIQKIISGHATFVPDRKLFSEKFSYAVYSKNFAGILRSLQG
jgi:phosphatidyl-myo-inositol dimannoside synthase